MRLNHLVVGADDAFWGILGPSTQVRICGNYDFAALRPGEDRDGINLKMAVGSGAVCRRDAG